MGTKMKGDRAMQKPVPAITAAVAQKTGEGLCPDRLREVKG